MDLFFRRMKSGYLLILVLIFISLIGSLVVSSSISNPNYEATVQLLAGGDRQDVATLDKYTLQDEMGFLSTYKEVIKSPLVLMKVNENTNLNLSMSEFKEGIKVAFENNSQVFNISFEHEDHETAVLVVNATAIAFLNEAGNVMNTNAITVLSIADMEDVATLNGINPLLKLFLIVLTALSAGVTLIYCIPEIYNTIRSVHEAEEILALPVIGEISQFTDRRFKSKAEVN